VTGDVIFAGEISGHFFFKDCFYCDSSERAFLLGLQLMSDENRSLAELVKPLRVYWQSGEINFKMPGEEQKQKVLAQIESQFSKFEIFKLDGTSVTSPDWQFNVRFSNTEPVVRVAVESFVSAAELDKLLAQVEGIIMSLGGTKSMH